MKLGRKHFQTFISLKKIIIFFIPGTRGEASQPGNIAHIVAAAVAQGEAWGSQGSSQCEESEKEEGGGRGSHQWGGVRGSEDEE